MVFLADVSSKNRMTEFYFTGVKPQVDLFCFDLRGLGKIKGKLSSMLPTELSGHLLESVHISKILQILSKFHYKRL